MEQKSISAKMIAVNSGQVEGLPKNPRFIRDERFKALVKSIGDAPEMLSLRELIVYPFGGKYVVIAGNMRFRACRELGYKEIPCKVLDESTPVEKLREYAIKDNVAFGSDDFDILANEWDVEELTDWGMENLDFDIKEEKPVLEAEEDDFDEGKDEIEKRCSLGDVWQLGEHRLMCGDSTKVESYERLMNGEKATLCFTDPPYGMKKESEGVMNDNLNYDELLDFNKKWIPLSFSNLVDNGSWYCWGIIEPIMDIYSSILKPKMKGKEISFRNLIVWKKGAFGSGGGTGVGQAIQRSYFPETEHCLFVMKGQQNYGSDLTTWYEGFEVFRQMFVEELNKAGYTIAKAIKITNNTGVGHYASKSQYAFPTKESWEVLRDSCNGIAFKQDYEKVKQDYEKVKQEWYSTRAYFDNTHDMMTDVWDFQRTHGEERSLCGGHATPKPLALCSRGIKSSSRENDIVLDCFGGSGSTLIACEQLNRKARLMELDPHYCDVIIARWEKITGKKAEKIN